MAKIEEIKYTNFAPDSLPQTPLGILWFGGPSNDAVLPRHGHGPTPQIINGRLIIEGRDMLRAVDVYTGRLLWEKNIEDLGHFYDNTLHHEGADGIGSNFVSTKDSIYAILPGKCIVLDPKTGKTKKEFLMPEIDGKKDLKWGNIRVYKEYLIATAKPLAVYLSENRSMKIKVNKKKRLFPSFKNAKYAAGSKYLIIFDRNSGKQLWHRKADYNFRHNGIAIESDKVFCIDNMSEPRKKELKINPNSKPKIYALNIKNGDILWATEQELFGTWLSYSKEYDILVQTGCNTGDSADDEANTIAAFNCSTGKELWSKNYNIGRIMLRHDQILGLRNGLHLKTGSKIYWKNPVNKTNSKWSFHRNYGCNAPIVSENLITFRSAAAGYYDLKNMGGDWKFRWL